MGVELLPASPVFVVLLLHKAGQASQALAPQYSSRLQSTSQGSSMVSGQAPKKNKAKKDKGRFGERVMHVPLKKFHPYCHRQRCGATFS